MRDAEEGDDDSVSWLRRVGALERADGGQDGSAARER